MLKAVSGALILCLIPLLAAAQGPSINVTGVRLLNVEVFGKSTDTPVVLLEEKKNGLVDPVLVQVDIRDDRYFAATICYPKDVAFELARASINQRYSKFELKRLTKTDEHGSIALWRNTESRFSIQLTTSSEADYLRVILITLHDPTQDTNPTKP